MMRFAVNLIVITAVVSLSVQSCNGQFTVIPIATVLDTILFVLYSTILFI